MAFEISSEVISEKTKAVQLVVESKEDWGWFW
jgi:hypothetical protein